MSGIPKKVIRLGLTSFFTDMSTESISSILSVYLYYFLGLGAYGLGILEGLAELISSLLKGLSGPLVDRLWSRKKGAVLGYSVSTAFKTLYLISALPMAGARALGLVIAARLGDRIGKGIRTSPRDAMLASVKGEKGRVFGIHRTLDQAGAIAGPLLAIPVFRLYGFKGVFAFALIPAVIAVLILWLTVEEEGRAGPSPLRLTFTAVGWRYLLGMALLSAGVFSFLFPLLRIYGEAGRSFLTVQGKVTLVMVFFILFNVTYTATSYPFGRLLDRVGSRASLILVSGILLFVDLVVFSMGVGLAAAVALTLLYGVFYSTYEVGRRAAAALATRRGAYGQGMGIMHMVTGLAALLGNAVFGYIWDASGPQFALLFSAAMASASLAFFTLVR